MQNNKRQVLGIAGIAAGVMFMLGTSQAFAVTTLKLSHNQNRDHAVHKAMTEFANEVKEKTNGEVRIRIYSDSQLGNQRESIELMQNGALDIAKSNAAELEAFSPAYSIFNLPYLFRDKAHYQQVINSDIGKEILDSSQNMGFIGLTYYDAGARSFYAKKPIRTPEDLKGLKIRVQPSPTAIAMVKGLEGSPTPLAYGELYTALQQGVVDAAENNITSFTLSRHSEVTKFFSLDEHTMIPDVLLISNKSLNKLTTEQQDIVKKAALNSSKYMIQLWEKSEKEERAKAEKQGVKFIVVDKTLFQNAVKPMYADIAKTQPELFEMVNRVRKVE
ncbi:MULTISPECIES: TRAP transporter substrate-binding protein [Xenorhabdus]|uniref:Periplasmic dicarboxylate-binding protein n=1 Tax=Xenorhabdus ehlersii TaxID=290111 RepID=A0A2D0IN29_9GAMM|nr:MULTISPECIES: TRAP transporter substrate-binding protein [Xenorhabdus]MBC8948078.1 periplasmic dicarboxylate-binding protein [Xenorhabdus sp. TS4]PHM23186.1 periplasmic dicarboxylate-binding protein [Xenorhabdus ehlersii]RKE89293.1 tripartite ATP-independent transporter DctP family solute receptor [Xenorhabdus ehlersii]